MEKNGFTLIEMTAVIVIMGLLAMAAILVLAHTAEKHRTETLCREIEQTDALVRSAAKQSGQTQRLMFDLVHNEIAWEQPDGRYEPMKMIRLSDNDLLTVRTVDQETIEKHVEIDVSPAGYSLSYALQIGHNTETPRWMIVAGMSGKTFWTDDEKQVATIFETLDGKDLKPAGAPVALSGLNPH